MVISYVYIMMRDVVIIIISWLFSINAFMAEVVII